MASVDVLLYEIVHRESDREYIGFTTQTAARRWSAHARAKTHIGGAIRKYGRDAFDYRVIAVFPDAASAKRAEIIAIAARRPAFNKTAGGDGANGYIPTPESNQKRRRALLGIKRSPDFCAKARAKTVSAASREKIRQARLGKKWPAEVREKCRRGRLGKPNTPEARAKISAALKGRPKSAEHVAKVAAALRARNALLRGSV